VRRVERRCAKTRTRAPAIPEMVLKRVVLVGTVAIRISETIIATTAGDRVTAVAVAARAISVEKHLTD
jgi:hypothetical protein